MKHIIILNGHAGEGTAQSHLSLIQEAFKNLDAEIHCTCAPGEATTFLRERLANETEQVRVYACGGDGTLHECLNGVVGHDNVELALHAIGTGNDFAKVYGGLTRFSDINKVIEGTVENIDISKITSPGLDRDIYCINAINAGFDAMVGQLGNVYKTQGKKDPYDKAIFPCLFKYMKNKIKIVVDGEEISGKAILLANFCHGQYVGGKFHTAPRSSNTDGLLEVCMAKPVSIFTFLGILKPFEKGEHLDGKYDKILKYRQGKEVNLSSLKDFYLCVDGEMYLAKEFNITVLPQSLKFVVPKE